MKKRILASLLAMVLLVSLLPVSALADPGTDAGDDITVTDGSTETPGDEPGDSPTDTPTDETPTEPPEDTEESGETVNSGTENTEESGEPVNSGTEDSDTQTDETLTEPSESTEESGETGETNDAETDVVTALQARIDALPTVEELADMTEAERDAVYQEVCEIEAAIAALTDEEAALLDMTALTALAAVFQEPETQNEAVLTVGVNVISTGATGMTYNIWRWSSVDDLQPI